MTFPRSSALLGLIAVISLALNLFLAGGLLGRQFHKPNLTQDFEARLNAVWEEMPNADQAIVREILGRHHDELVAKWRASRTANQHAGISLHSAPFDPNEAHGNFVTSNQRSMELRIAVQDTLIEIAGKISDEGREHLRFGPGL